MESLKEMGEINMTGKLEFDLPFLDIWEEFNQNEKLVKLPLDKLLIKLNELEKKNETDESNELYEEILRLRDTIGFKLSVISVPVFQSFMEKICEESKAMEERIMAKVRNHRHDTSKVFTGRAEY